MQEAGQAQVEKNEAEVEEKGTPENGDIFNQHGEHVGNIQAFTDIGEIVDAELGVLHEGKLYVFKLEYRSEANFD